MKRRVFAIMVFLLLGAIVNVAVGWGLAAWSPVHHEGTRSNSRGPLPDLPLWWEALDPDLRRVAAIVQFDLRGIGRSGRAVSTDNKVWCFTQSGWPFEAIACVEEVQIKPGAVAARWGLRIRSTADGLASAVVPLRPIWPGFAINTLFYATIVAMLFAATSSLRRWRRHKRGLCPKCGYDLRGSARDATVCPECGVVRLRV